MTIGDTIGNKAQGGEDDLAPPRFAMRSGDTVRKAGRTFLDILLPPLCLGCGARLVDHDALCPPCWKGIDFIRPPLCDRLGIPLPYDTGGPMLSAAAVADPPDFDQARAVARYDGLMRTLIHKFKFNDTQIARRLFARWLVEAGAELIAASDVVVAVPLAQRRLLWRRFNQSQLLANEIARLTAKPVAPLALQRVRATRSQVGLTRKERVKNVAGAFRVLPRHVTDISGKSVLLIDDVITTGATVNSAARALRKAGAVRVSVLALSLAGDVPHTP